MNLMATANKIYRMETPILTIVRRAEIEKIPKIKFAPKSESRMISFLQEELDERTSAIEILFDNRLRKFERHYNIDPEKTASGHIGGFKEEGSIVPPTATIGSLVVVLATGVLHHDDIIVGQAVVREDRTRLKI